MRPLGESQSQTAERKRSYSAIASRIRSRDAILLWAAECLILLQAKAHSRARALARWSKSPLVPALRLTKKASGEISVRISLRFSWSGSREAHASVPWAP
ncbi:MAG: hypothetical protein LBQ12_07145 [Deltaproteobacteria bacterium]|nr:hypothetical protein [Deltaproteobacteria bacterium]